MFTDGQLFETHGVEFSDIADDTALPANELAQDSSLSGNAAPCDDLEYSQSRDRHSVPAVTQLLPATGAYQDVEDPFVEDELVDVVVVTAPRDFTHTDRLDEDVTAIAEQQSLDRPAALGSAAMTGVDPTHSVTPVTSAQEPGANLNTPATQAPQRAATGALPDEEAKQVSPPEGSGDNTVPTRSSVGQNSAPVEPQPGGASGDGIIPPDIGKGNEFSEPDSPDDPERKRIPEERPARASRFTEATPEGDIVPLDPVTGEILRVDAIPESLWADDDLRRGYEFLAQESDRIYFDLLLTRHNGKDALDESGIDIGETLMKLNATGGLLVGEGAEDEIEKSQEQAYEDQQYGDVLLGQVQAVPAERVQGVEVERVDYSSKSARPADRALTEWRRDMQALLHIDSLYAAATAERNGELKAYDAHLAAFVGLEVYRDWYLVGRIGMALADFNARRQSGDDINAAGLFGSFHVGIGRRMEAMGIRVTYQGNSPEQLQGRDAILVRSIENGTITINDRIRYLASIISIQASEET